MSTYRELVYIILDQIRATSDDSLYNDAHISYLIDKYRSMLLKQKYSLNQKLYIIFDVI